MIMLLNFCWPGFVCEVVCLPDVVPTEYLFEKHADKGKERWEIYAWAVREIMIEAGGYKRCDM